MRKWKKMLAHRIGRRIGQIALLHRWAKLTDFDKKMVPYQIRGSNYASA